MITILDIKTKSRVEFQDITGRVGDIVADSGVRDGLCYLFVPHTTAGIMVNEHADPSVVEDIIVQLDKLVPHFGNYSHSEGNSAAHIKACIIGNSLTLFVADSQLVLGTWQGIFFGEFDGPRSRHVLVKVTADKV